MQIDFNVVIPARYASSRLPGKPLLEIAGKPMVILVVEQARKSGAKKVVVATDDQRIFNVVSQFGCDVVMTRADHQSGTDRIAEVSDHLKWQQDEVVVNVQGDEPLIEPEVIRQVAKKLALDDLAVMSTACFPINNWDDFRNPNIVKVVLNNNDHALYFSRAPIPYPRDNNFLDNTQEKFTLNAYRHIGIYGYRAGFLKKYTEITPAYLESIEKLEQLRVLHQGFKIAVTISANEPATGVDTKEDYIRVCNYVENRLLKL